jgi:hypothetical protein
LENWAHWVAWKSTRWGSINLTSRYTRKISL